MVCLAKDRPNKKPLAPILYYLVLDNNSDSKLLQMIIVVIDNYIINLPFHGHSCLSLGKLSMQFCSNTPQEATMYWLGSKARNKANITMIIKCNKL